MGARSKDCETCNGTGKVSAPVVTQTPPGFSVTPVEPPAAADGSPLATLKLALDAMHETCTVCDGRRYHPRNSVAWCYDCNGTGRVLTPAGREIVNAMVALLADHFAPTDHGHSIS